ncbi:hypothetical protein K1719_009246 [Acacia pycnantha]|nr:hypothetical protein K1719_009246 [Acacia pycnantha]
MGSRNSGKGFLGAQNHIIVYTEFGLQIIWQCHHIIYKLRLTLDIVAKSVSSSTPWPISSSNHIDYGFRFADEQVHGTPTPAGWGLLELERIDVKQADVAPVC